MNTMYPDLENSFPEDIDNLDKMQDITIETKPLADQYGTLVGRGDFDAANQLIAENDGLRATLFNADKYNLMRDAVISLQRLFRDNIQQYVAGQLYEHELLLATYRHEYDAATKTHNFVGAGENGKVKVAYPYAPGDKIAVNGTELPAYCGNEELDEDSFPVGRWIMFVCDGTQVNFSGGGGLTKRKLEAATAAASHVLTGKTFYAGSKALKTGTMPNRGAISHPITVGGSYTIPEGYHNGSGKVTGPTLTGDAAAGNVLSGRTFYSNSGTKQTGTMTDCGAIAASVAVGGAYTIPVGYHNGSGKVTGPALDGNAAANQVLSGRTFYSDSGTKQTGTISTKAAESKTFTPSTEQQSYTFATSGKYCSGDMTVNVEAKNNLQFWQSRSMNNNGLTYPAYAITIPANGNYRIYLVLGISANSQDSWSILNIYKNGNSIADSNSNGSHRIDKTIYCNAGDIIALGTNNAANVHGGYCVYKV